MAETPVLIEEKISQMVFFLKVLERLVHGRDQWAVRLNDSLHPVQVIVDGDRVGVQVTTIRNTEEFTCSPVLLCNDDEVLFHPPILLPEHVVEFTWWISLQPQPV